MHRLLKKIEVLTERHFFWLVCGSLVLGLKIFVGNMSKAAKNILKEIDKTKGKKKKKIAKARFFLFYQIYIFSISSRFFFGFARVANINFQFKPKLLSSTDFAENRGRPIYLHPKYTKRLSKPQGQAKSFLVELC